MADTPSLDEAWKECEAALPEGWHWTSLVYAPKPDEWTASVAGPSHQPHRTPGARGVGPTPAAALLDLAARLREVDS